MSNETLQNEVKPAAEVDYYVPANPTRMMGPRPNRRFAPLAESTETKFIA